MSKVKNQEKTEHEQQVSISAVYGAAKNIAIALPFILAICLAFWKSEVREWLTSEIKIELEESENSDWFYSRVSGVFEDLSPEEAIFLQDNTKLKEIVRNVVREEISGGQLDGLTTLEANHQNVIQAILNPPAYANLEAIVTQRVDAIYTFELYDRRSLQVFIPENSDEASSEFLQSILVSDVSARFYAAADQSISISIYPSYGDCIFDKPDPLAQP